MTCRYNGIIRNKNDCPIARAIQTNGYNRVAKEPLFSLMHDSLIMVNEQ